MSIYDELYDYQRDVVNLYKDKKAFGLFVDMGCGKTPMALALAEQNQCIRIIIISINAKATEDETIKGSFFWWAQKSKYKYILYNKKVSFRRDGPKKYWAEVNSNDPAILLINYESLFERNSQSKCELRKNLDDFIHMSGGHNMAIIVDESHNIKDTTSIQTKAVEKVQRECYRCCKRTYSYLLTGTPFTKGYIDVYNQLKFLGCQLTKTRFIEDYCIRGQFPSLMSWQQPIVGYKNVDLLYDLIHKFAITMKTSDVIKLPEQIFTEHVVPQSEAMRLFTHEELTSTEINSEINKRNLSDEYYVERGPRGGKVNNPFHRNIAYPDDTWIADTPALTWMRARQLSIGFQGNEMDAAWYDKARFDELRNLLRTDRQNYVLFYNFTPEFTELYDLCDSLDYKIDVYNGFIKDLSNYDAYENLSESEKMVDDGGRIILANFASGSTGKNWQEYHKCILFSLPLFGDYQQGIKRVHRVGQAYPVEYHLFKSNNWLDKKMWSVLTEQKQYDEKMFMKDLKEAQRGE